MRGSWNALVLLLVVAISGGVGYYFTAINPIQEQMKLGLDLKGGVHMVLEGVDSELGPVTSEKMESALKVIENRINSLGVSEPDIRRDTGNRIIIQIAGETDTERARELVGRTAVLAFVDMDGEVVIDGNDIDRAGVAQNQSGVGYTVTLKLKGEGPEKFRKATAANIGNPIAILLDDEVISSPTVNDEISGGEAIITGNFTAEEAKDLSDLINGGALPVKLEMKENRVVSATLGMDSLTKSAKAGMYGLLLVLFFMLVVYRVPGLIANIALTIYAMLVLGVLIGINAVFTLPGLAGILLSIGMAVDANIIIFERIKEELRSGKGLRSGIDAGFSRAFRAILDSNVTTVIAGVVLWQLGTGPVKGFALTLIVGVLLSMFTSITITRGLITLAVRTGWFGKNLFGIKEVAN
jgi:preprotein translocase subunit SecD